MMTSTLKMFNQKAKLNRTLLGSRIMCPTEEQFMELVYMYEGFDDAHAHLCRADTEPPPYLSHIHTTPLQAAFAPLRVKQSMMGNLHDGIAYGEKDLRERMKRVIERLIKYGTTRVCTCIDATPDIGEDGQLAMRVAAEIKKEYADRIAIGIGPTPIFGFKKGTGRWEVFAKAAEQADFLAALPEKDDYTCATDRDGRIGYREHLREVIALACEKNLPVQIHIDQANDPREKGTETLIEGLRGWVRQPEIVGRRGPSIWLIHGISLSAADEKYFGYIASWLRDLGIGVHVCPSAGLSNRQLRPIVAPMHNPVARVLELSKMKIPVQIGTDNICDLFVPFSDGDMLTEIKILAHELRFPILHVLAKLACGVVLNEIDIAAIGEALYQDRKVFVAIDPSWVPAVE